MCGSLFEPLRAYYERCTPPGSPLYVGSEKSRYELFCSKQLAAPGAGEPYSATLQSCANAIATQACDAEVPCGADFRGSLADDTACAESYQCASGYCAKAGDIFTALADCGKCAPKIPLGGTCNGGSTTSCADGGICVTVGDYPGVCQPKRKTVKAGEACGNDQVECEKGTVCSFEPGPISTTPSVCRPRIAAGGECTLPSNCASGLTCVQSKCVEAPGLGLDCVAPLFGTCANNLVCGTDKKCQNVVLAKAGEDCDDVTRRCARGRCKLNDYASPIGEGLGKCVDPLPDGAACPDESDRLQPRPCDVFAKCINKVCTLVDPASCK